jgi:hypothetical protein
MISAERERDERRQLERQKERERRKQLEAAEREGRAAPESAKEPKTALGRDALALQTAMSKYAAPASREPAPNTPIKRSMTNRVGTPEPQAAPPKKTSESKGAKATDPRKKADAETLSINSEVIISKLKLHYMRTRDTELAIAFLYGKNSDGK